MATISRLRAALLPDAGMSGEALLEERSQDSARLLAALERAGRLPENVRLDARSLPVLTPALADAIEAFIAEAPSALMSVQLEDVFAVREQANLPGTIDEHPNWRHKLPVALEAMRDDVSWNRLATILRTARGRRMP